MDAGVQVGDELTALDGFPVTGWAAGAAIAYIGARGSGSQVTLRLRRDGVERDVVVTLGAEAIPRPSRRP